MARDKPARRRGRAQRIVLGLVILILAGGLGLTLLWTRDEPILPHAITSAATNAPLLVGQPAVPHAVPGTALQCCGLADGGRASMHADGAGSNTHPTAGPLGLDPVVQTRLGSVKPGGECAVQVATKAGKLITLCGNIFNMELLLLDPATLKLLAREVLPGRSSTIRAALALDPDKIMNDTSGAYFFLDAQDRIIVADSHRQVRRFVTEHDGAGNWAFRETGNWDLSAAVPHDCVELLHWWPSGECDSVVAVMPDKNGTIWWVTRNGRVGTLDLATGTIHASLLAGEEIENGFSVAEDGVYIVSDHAMYRYETDADGAPAIGWRETYDRGTSRKLGQINQGSGTTPVIIGDRYVGITDNADDRVALLVYRREQGFAGTRLICRVPLFTPGASAAENSPVGWGRSIIVENTFGYTSAFMQTDWSHLPGGMTRVDIRPDDSGCDEVWTSPIRSPTVVPKLSSVSGLLYAYAVEVDPAGVPVWRLSALDFDTGKTVYGIRAGAGRSFDNNWAAISLVDGTAFVGVFSGLVSVHDGPAPN